MAEKVPALVNVAATLTGKSAPAKLAVKPIINSKKVSDHHAIIPTLELQKCNLTELPKGEYAILQLIATRLFSVLYGRTLHIGRVVSPTLAMAVLREAEINVFQPEAIYTVRLLANGCEMVSDRFKE